MLTTRRLVKLIAALLLLMAALPGADGLRHAIDADHGERSAHECALCHQLANQSHAVPTGRIADAAPAPHAHTAVFFVADRHHAVPVFSTVAARAPPA